MKWKTLRENPSYIMTFEKTETEYNRDHKGVWTYQDNGKSFSVESPLRDELEAAFDEALFARHLTMKAERNEPTIGGGGS